MVVLHICLLHLHIVVCALVFVVFFRTFRPILYDILWNTHFYFYLGGQSVSISFSDSPPTV